MENNPDLAKWQNTIQSIEWVQKNLSIEELKAFQTLKEIFNNENFESRECDNNIKIIKDALPSHNNNKLLKVHLTNFIDLCEKFFIEKERVEEERRAEQKKKEERERQEAEYRRKEQERREEQEKAERECREDDEGVWKSTDLTKTNYDDYTIQPPFADDGKKSSKLLIFVSIAAVVVLVLLFFGIKMTKDNKEQKERELIALIEEERRQRVERDRIAVEEARLQQAERDRIAREEEQKRQQASVIVNGVSFEMVYVQGGSFTMGCTSEQGGDCQDRERPAHQVTLSSFFIGKYVVTQAQWVAIMGNNPSRVKGDNLPVEYVSWNNVQDFIRRLNARTSRQYRLPTEAEWEYAARGGVKSQGYKYSGSNNVNDVAWYNGNSSGTRPVGTKQPNELGIYDMSGNVWEWCSDFFGNYPSSAQNNPQGSSSGTNRSDRGGSWYYGAEWCRISARSSYGADGRGHSLGFRLAHPAEVAGIVEAQTNILSVLSTRLLTENDLRGLSKQELRIMRNTIFARHGYIFQSQDLRDHFSAMEWYRPRLNDVSHLLNTIEKQNVAIIQKYE